MDRQNATVQINSDVLRWVIKGSGWDVEELSKQTNIRSESIQKWETTDAVIRVKDLQKISRAIKRPLSVLLLPEPPKEKILTDYRKTDKDNDEKLSRKALDAIRKARYVQSNAKEILELRSENTRPSITNRTLEDDPEDVARIERKMLGLESESREKGMGIDKFVRRVYQNLKAKIESLNILVMQDTMEINVARGFALVDGYPRVIMINSADKPRPRLFTLLHEYAHILLKKDGICTPNSENFKNYSASHNPSIERWCNKFAGAVVMPKTEFLELFKRADMRHEASAVVAALSSEFCTSKMATAVRILNLIGNDPRREKYLEYYNSIAFKSATPNKDRGRNGRNLVKECINRNGMLYARLVSDSRDMDLITTSDMIKYLNLKIKYFEDLNTVIHST